MMHLILIVLCVLIIGILLLGLLLPKKFTIVSTAVINRKNADVFNYVKNIKNQEKYSKWVMADPNIKLTYTGNDGTVGFKSAWVSDMKNVGVGEQEITNITDGKSIDMEVRFEKPFKGVSQANTSTEYVAENETKVTTTFVSASPFPMNIMSAIFCKMIKKDMDENSSNLKKILEG